MSQALIQRAKDRQSGKFPKVGRLGSSKQGGDELMTAKLSLKCLNVRELT